MRVKTKAKHRIFSHLQLFWRHPFADAKKGSFTVSLTIVMAGLLALAIVLQQISAFRIYQVELAQATALQLQGSLARYDRALVQRYGLWGLRPDSLSDHIFTNCTELSHQQESVFLPHIESEIDQILTQPLADPKWAAKQIKPYMQLRAQLTLMQEYYQRYQEYQGKIQTDLMTNKNEIEKNYYAFERERGRIEEVLTNSDSAEAKQALALLHEALGAHSEIAEATDPSTDSYSDIFLSEAIEGIAKLENVIKLPPLPIYDHLLINEYVMGHFSYATSQFGIPENEERTWGGWRKRNLQVKNPYEIESIAWQDLSGKSALRKTKILIMGVRLAQHFAAIQMNASRRAKFESWARIIHYAIFLLTGGSIYIPEEVLTNAFIIIRSAYLAYKDCKILLQGESVSLVPEDKSFPVFYHDFLRLILCFSTEKSKIQHSVYWIQENLGGHFYTGVRASVHFLALPWKGGHIEQETAYVLDKK